MVWRLSRLPWLRMSYTVIVRCGFDQRCWREDREGEDVRVPMRARALKLGITLHMLLFTSL